MTDHYIALAATAKLCAIRIPKVYKKDGLLYIAGEINIYEKRNQCRLMKYDTCSSFL